MGQLYSLLLELLLSMSGAMLKGLIFVFAALLILQCKTSLLVKYSLNKDLHFVFYLRCAHYYLFTDY